MIEEAVKTLFDVLGQRASEAFLWLTDPFFWFWLPLGIGVALAAFALAWFFPVLRSLSGAVVVSIAAALAAYRKGQIDERERRKPDPPKPTPKPPTDYTWPTWPKW